MPMLLALLALACSPLRPTADADALPDDSGILPVDSAEDSLDTGDSGGCGGTAPEVTARFYLDTARIQGSGGIITELLIWGFVADTSDVDGDLQAWTLLAWFEMDGDGLIDTDREPDEVTSGGGGEPCAVGSLEVGVGGVTTDATLPWEGTIDFAVAVEDASGERSAVAVGTATAP